MVLVTFFDNVLQSWDGGMGMCATVLLDLSADFDTFYNAIIMEFL